MDTNERVRRALYARLEEVLGTEHADALMTHIPPQPSTELATKTDIEALGDRFDARMDQVVGRMDQVDVRFDRLEDRFDRLEERMDRFMERIDDRFERINDRFDRMHETLRDQMRTYTVIMVGGMTALTAIYAGLLVAIR